MIKNIRKIIYMENKPKKVVINISVNFDHDKTMEMIKDILIKLQEEDERYAKI